MPSVPDAQLRVWKKEEGTIVSSKFWFVEAPNMENQKPTENLRH